MTLSDSGRIRVLVVSHTVHAWGAEQRILDTARRLAASGVDMTLAAPPDATLANSWHSSGLPVVSFLPRPRAGLRRSDDTRPGPAALARQIAAVATDSRVLARLAKHFEIMHSHSLSANLDVAVAAQRSRRGAVLDVHDIVRPGLGRLVLTAGALLADATIVNSEATRAAILTPVRGLRVIPPGVDTDRFYPGPADCQLRAQLAAAPDDPIVGIIGRVDPGKGIAVLVEAARRLNVTGRPLNVAVVGAPASATVEWSEDLLARARAALGVRVRFLGARSDIPDILRAIDLFVNASDCEPFGRSVLEAQASGVPVVATRAGGIPEFVEDGRSGLLVPPQDPGALASAIGRLLDQPDLGRRLAGNARLSATGQYSAAAHAAEVGSLYEMVARRRTRRRDSRGGPPEPLPATELDDG